MLDDQVLISNPGTGFPDFLLDDSYMNAMLCAEEAELMCAQQQLSRAGTAVTAW